MSQNNPTQNGNGNGQDCIRMWEEELKEVNNALVIAQADCDMLAIAYGHAGEWKGKLDGYWREIQQTNELVDNIASELELFAGHTATICSNIDCIKQAVGLVWCILEKASRGLDEISSDVAAMINDIECLNIPGIEGDKSLILNCLKEIQEQINAALLLRKTAITQLLDAWKCICLLEKMICGECSGLTYLLEELRCLFGEPITKSGNCEGEPVVDDKSCGETIDPKPMLPPDCDVYYSDTKSQYDTAVADLVTCKEKFDKARETKETLLSCRNGLQDAIECAMAAKNC